MTFGSCGGGNPAWVTPIGLTFNRAGTTCIKAQAALNAANTLMIVMTPTGAVNTTGGIYESPLIGNGAGGTVGANGFFLNGLGVGNASVVPQGFCNGATADVMTPTMPYGSPSMLTEVFSTGNDVIYFNDIAPTIPLQLAACSAQSTGVYQVGGAPAGSGYALPTYFDGTVYALAAFSGKATAAQVAAAYRIILDYLTKTGVSMNGSPTSSGNSLVLKGDSQSQGPGLLYAYYNPTVNSVSNVSVIGFAGNPATAELSNAPYTLAGAIPTKGTGGNCTVHDWYGTVDIVTSGKTAAQTWASINSILRQDAASSCKVIASTVVSSTGFDATIEAYDALLRAQWRSTGAAYLSDLASVPTLGASGASTTNPCFTDGVHQTQGCVKNIDAPLVQNAISAIYGNQDASTATIYGSAAAAAVATTAGSETGNTISVTLASAPANCLVGNFMHIAGTTPAGYSTSTSISSMGWQILTVVGSTYTFYDDTTGLGAITIQGTGVCPQQQPKDVYSIVNFGVGNFTLMSCQGWTGQTKTIQNINAVATTLVPDGAEGITGIGATSSTLAANSTAVIQSVLVSAAAGGCNLVRLQ